jgi:hypothetical protein
MRSFLLVTPILLLVFFSLAMLAKVLGAQQPINPALAGFIEGCEDKPQPCWYGMMPGITVEEGWDILDAQNYLFVDPSKEGFADAGNPYYQSKWCNIYFQPSFPADETINLIEISHCKGIRLGDVMAILGSPEALVLEYTNIAFQYVDGGILVSTTPANTVDLNLGPPTKEIYSITFLYNPDYIRTETFPWHGFTRRWGYCSMEPAGPYCSWYASQE